jgi:hypothetical protein
MADIDAAIPGLCGEVTLDTIHFGVGSTNGILLCLPNLKGGLMEKFITFHAELYKLLMNLDPLELMITGYIKVDGVIRSIFTRREYSYIDTEHILCKIYVCLELSHTSRTISDKPKCHSSSTWPITQQCRFWSAKFSLSMKQFVLKSFEEIMSAKPEFRTYIKKFYPPKLTYDFPKPDTVSEESNLCALVDNVVTQVAQV